MTARAGSLTGQDIPAADAPPEWVLTSVRSLVDYNWQAEERDYIEQREAGNDSPHIFEDLRALEVWLTNHLR
jgi:hypothetical protein